MDTHPPNRRRSDAVGGFLLYPTDRRYQGVKMDFNTILSNLSFLWSPGIFAILATLAVLFIWIAVAPSRRKRAEDGRLQHVRLERWAKALMD